MIFFIDSYNSKYDMMYECVYLMQFVITNSTRRKVN